jgi:ferritin-like metal-binding protein YciE
MAHKMNGLEDLYLNQLQDNYSANKQMAGIVGEFEQAAKNDKLKNMLSKSKQGISKHNETLKSIITKHGGNPDGEHCKGMEGLVKEGRAHGLEPEFGDPSVQDAAIIAQMQRMSHYGLAGFGTAKAMAEALGKSDEAQQLDVSLGDIYDADEYLTNIAEQRVNPKAAH